MESGALIAWPAPIPGTRMSMGIALAIGLLAGAHTSTWGMYKDCPYEGFTYRKYLGSILISALLAVAWQSEPTLGLLSPPFWPE